MFKTFLIATITLISLVSITLVSHMAKGESRAKNQDDNQAQPPSLSVEQADNQQANQDILDYWTPERMRNAQPLMPTVPEDGVSGEPTIPEEGVSGEAKPPQIDSLEPKTATPDAVIND
ncbi:MAG: hypothetical protein F6K31_34465 [Symploca sp. SIO2G7]|nr:hypothetical protein [Symploca sp. SIO2G7]